MDDNYEDENLTDYEEFQATLKTPENQLIDITFSNNKNDFDLNDCTDYREPLLNTTADDYVQPLDDSEEIELDLTEWQIIDPRSGKNRRPRQNEFLELLLANTRYTSYICWVDKDQGLCRILLPNQVAALWGKVKRRQTNGKMTYQTFARGLRYHYTIGSMMKTKKKHTFCLKKSPKNGSS